MKKHLALSLAVASIGLSACHKKQTPGPAPVISSIMPAHAAGGETITINGDRFSTNKAEDLVTINGVNATVISATSTALTVTVPPKVGSGEVKVVVKGETPGAGPNFMYDWKISSATTLQLTKGGAAFNFSVIYGMAMDKSGNLVVSDQSLNQIFKVAANNTVSVFAGSGVAGNQNGAPANAQFNSPEGIAFDAAGNLYVADFSNNVIRKIDQSGNVTTIAGSGTSGSADGTGASATFNKPDGLTVNSTGDIFVNDPANGLLRKISSSSYQVTTIAGTGATAGLLGWSYGLCADSKGVIYMADRDNNKIFKITPDGVVTVFAGSGDSGNLDGIGTAAQFSSPGGICSDSGTLYVADHDNSNIRKIDPTGVVTTFAGSGANSTSGAAITFSSPTAITFDAKKHNFYVSDNGTIKKITLQ